MEKTIQAGTLLDGRYELHTRLEEGGMGRIYCSWDHAKQRFVAVKIPLPSKLDRSVKRLRRETDILERLQHHRRIVRFLDAGDAEETEYLVLELLPNFTLQDLLCRKGRLNAKMSVEIAVAMLEGLEAVHALGVVHRDIKSENVLFRDGEPVLIDFGLVTPQPGQAAGRITISGGIVGTPRYLAPEQGRDAKLDARTDLYSCGHVLYEMLTGTHPHPVGKTFEQMLDAKLNFQPRSFFEATLDDSIPEELETIVRVALSPDPGDRFGSATEMREALLKAVP